MTMTSSTRSTVRNAVLNGVFSGTRSMPRRMSVIFIERLTDALDAVDLIDEHAFLCDQVGRQRRHGHAIHRHANDRSAAAILDVRGVMDDVRQASIVTDHHHHMPGDINEIADLEGPQALDALLPSIVHRKRDAYEGRAHALIARIARQLHAEAAIHLRDEAAAVACVVGMPPTIAFA